jgi:hypothetical protein
MGIDIIRKRSFSFQYGNKPAAIYLVMSLVHNSVPVVAIVVIVECTHYATGMLVE